MDSKRNRIGTKKRLPKKLYCEMFVDHNIGAGVRVIVKLLSDDKKTDCVPSIDYSPNRSLLHTLQFRPHFSP